MKKIFMIAIAMLGFVAMAGATNVMSSELEINTLSATTESYLGGFTKIGRASCRERV